MKISELVSNGDFKLVSGEEAVDSNEIKGVYSCDLLSWVMSHADENDAWITVQAHSNIVAIASLLELSCIIIVDDAPIEADTISKANEHDIPIIVTSMSSYEVITLLNKIGI